MFLKIDKACKISETTSFSGSKPFYIYGHLKSLAKVPLEDPLGRLYFLDLMSTINHLHQWFLTFFALHVYTSDSQPVVPKNLPSGKPEYSSWPVCVNFMMHTKKFFVVQTPK